MVDQSTGCSSCKGFVHMWAYSYCSYASFVTLDCHNLLQDEHAGSGNAGSGDAGGNDDVDAEADARVRQHWTAPRYDQERQRYLHQAAGLVGLKNLGNTCFANSVTQCFGHLNPFRAIGVGSASAPGCLEGNPYGSGGKLPKAFLHLLKQLWQVRTCALHVSNVNVVMYHWRCVPYVFPDGQCLNIKCPMSLLATQYVHQS